MAPAVFSCTHCEYKNPRSTNLRNHIKYFHKEINPNIHRCKFCDQMFETFVDMKMHMAKKLCETTNQEFAKQLEKNLTRRRYLNCLKCSFKSFKTQNVFSHMEIKHNIDPKEIFNCKICRQMFILPNARHFRFHLQRCLKERSIPQKEYLVNCSDNNKQGSKQNQLTSNTRLTKQSQELTAIEAEKSGTSNQEKDRGLENPKRGDGKKIYRCLCCRYNSKNAGHIRRHMRLVHDVANPLINECELCGDMFRNYFVLRSHKRVCKNREIVDLQAETSATTTEMEFKCVVCKSKFGEKVLLQQHMNSEHNMSLCPQVYSCNRCQKLFEIGTELTNHILTCGTKNGNHRKKLGRGRTNKRGDNNEYPADKNKDNTRKQNFAAKETPREKLSSNGSHYRRLEGDNVKVRNARKKAGFEISSSSAKLLRCLKQNCRYTSKKPNFIQIHMRKAHGLSYSIANNSRCFKKIFQNSRLRVEKKIDCKKTTQELSREKVMKKSASILMRRDHKTKPKSETEPQTHQTEDLLDRTTKLCTYKCEECDVEYKHASSLRRHRRVKHNLTNPNNKSECHNVSSNENLNHHNKTLKLTSSNFAHKKAPNITSPNTGREKQSLQQQNVHMKEKNSVNLDTSEDKIKKRQHCDKMFSYQLSLKQHKIACKNDKNILHLVNKTKYKLLRKSVNILNRRVKKTPVNLGPSANCSSEGSVVEESFLSNEDSEAHFLLRRETKLSSDVSDEGLFQDVITDVASENLSVTSESNDSVENLEEFESYEEDVNENYEHNYEEYQDNEVLRLHPSDLSSVDEILSEQFDVGDPNLPSDEEIQSLASSPESSEIEIAENSVRPFAFGTKFYTSKGEEIDLTAKENEGTLYYVCDF